MPQIIEATVFRLDELSPSAKERARCWYRQAGLSDDWYDSVFEDFRAICAILGVQLKCRPVRLLGGGMSEAPCIWFSGFASQGDGACFEGWYGYIADAATRIRQYAPVDTALHAIADRLQVIQRRNFYELFADLTHRGRYYHEYTMAVAVERDNALGQAPTEGAEEIVTEALRDLARWLYRQLEREHDYLLSDEVVDEAILANEYSFTEAGERFG